jgi:hypothetical protein
MLLLTVEVIANFKTKDSHTEAFSRTIHFRASYSGEESGPKKNCKRQLGFGTFLDSNRAMGDRISPFFY